MNYTEEYNTKDAMITLLQDFLSNITEEYEASEDIVQVLSSPANDEYIEKIKSGLELCCPAEIEEKFTQTISLIYDLPYNMMPAIYRGYIEQACRDRWCRLLLLVIFFLIMILDLFIFFKLIKWYRNKKYYIGV